MAAPQLTSQADRFIVDVAAQISPDLEDLESGWEAWLDQHFSEWFHDPTGQPLPHSIYHREFWEWVWSVQRGIRLPAFVAVWPRDGGKSTCAEIACVVLACRKARGYAIYVSATQDQADDHVANISALLETKALSEHYPDVVRRRLNKYGHSQGWRRNRLRTASGFTIDALGLNTGARGIKVESDRPDLIVLDDVDDELDTVTAVAKKEKILQRKVLPAGSRDATVLAVQNLVWSESVFSRLVDGRARYLTNRIVSGPYPAIEELRLEQQGGRPIITGGQATWQGLSLQRCQEIIEDVGVKAFLREHQHETEGQREGALWSHDLINRVTECPPLIRIVIGVDPAGGTKKTNSETGILAVGLGEDGRCYVLRDLSGRWSPSEWGNRVVRCYDDLQADRVIGERNYGGDMVKNTVLTVPGGHAVRYRDVKATRGKAVRAEPVAALYEQGLILHVGEFADLEAQMVTWVPSEEHSTSPDRVDSLVFAVTELMLGPKVADTSGVTLDFGRRRSRWQVK